VKGADAWPAAIPLWLLLYASACAAEAPAESLGRLNQTMMANQRPDTMSAISPSYLQSVQAELEALLKQQEQHTQLRQGFHVTQILQHAAKERRR
jgi:hypothetical protein